MAKSDGTVYIDTRVDTKGFSTGMNTIEKRVDALGSSIKKLGGAIASAFAVKQLVSFSKKCIELGSDLQEVENVVDTVFTTMSEEVDKFAKGAAEAAGLSETMAKRYVGTFGAMAKAFGFAESEAFSMSTALTQLAGDVASFYNITQDEAYTKLKSVFTGETETLKDLGVVMTQSALDAYAMAEGLGKTTREMTEQEKVALRYRFVLNQLSSASGDFARTSDSWANQMRILKLNIESIMATLGQALINFFTPVIKVVNTVLSKIATLANAFKALSEMITGKKSESKGSVIKETASDLQDLSSGYGSSAESAEDLTDATNKAAKANKKYLSGLDEIRTFQSEDKPEGSGSPLGTITGGLVDFGTIDNGTGAVEEVESALSKVVDRAKELVDLFKEGFKEGLGDTTDRLASLKNSVASIKESFAFIFDEKTVESINDDIDTIVRSFGEIAGAGASIGLTLATNLIGGISLYLEDAKEEIQQYIVDMFDIGAQISTKFADLSTSIAYIFESFANEDGQQITENLIAVFVDSFMEITRLISQFGLDVITLLVDPFVNSQEQIKQSFEDFLAGVNDFTSSIRTIYEEGFDFLSQIYEEYISPIFQNLIPEMEAFYQEHMAPLLTKVGEFFALLGENLSVFWEESLKPAIEWFKENVMPVIAPVLEALGKIAIEFSGYVIDAVSAVLDVLGGLITFITGLFTADWQRAWEGIKQIFSGIINTITSTLEFVINTAINLVNGLIEGVNGISGKIGIPAIPTIPNVDIPMLATGAVIPPNAPFMAVLGDQKKGTNIEAPEDLIRKIVREESGGGNGAIYHFVAQLNGQTLFEQFVSQAELVQMSTGNNPLEF